MSFDKSVFINCPFDDKYRPLLRPMLFCVLALGFEPRIALESLDSGQARLEKIILCIAESKFSIHDISRLQAGEAGEFYRMNMPFELGLDLGCRRFKGGQWSGKKCLILETERHRYQAAISDISSFDIEAHNDRPVEVVSVVRNWLNNVAKLGAAPGPAAVWGRFNDFMAANYDALKGRGFSDRDIRRLQINELIVCIKDWLGDNQLVSSS